MGGMEDEVRELIAERFGSVPKLAQEVDLPAQTIYSALRNGLSGASTSTVLPIAEALEIDPFWILRGRVVQTHGKARGVADVALVGTITAGTPLEPIVSEDSYPVPREVLDKFPGAFLLRVSGESMNRVLPSGCYALISPCDEITASGRVYAVAIGASEATIKRVQLLDNGVMLVPDSTDPTFHSQLFDYADPDCENLTVIGRVVWYCIPTDWHFE